MEPVILHQIPFQIDTESLKKKLHIKDESPYLTDLMGLVGEAKEIGRPKALYKMAFIDNRGEDFVIVDGIRLKSRVLRVNLESAQRIFPYVVTCGMELEEWSNRIEDVLKRFWADAIKEMVMRYAHTVMEDHLVDHLRPGKLSRMSPGSLADWPIQEQRPLFEILGNARDTIGVRLTESLLMIPTKSVSGIRFPTEENFESCQLCPREECPNRRAPYDPSLYEKRFSKKNHE